MFPQMLESFGLTYEGIFYIEDKKFLKKCSELKHFFVFTNKRDYFND